MQTQKNYKNAGMQILVPDNSAEPLNAMSSNSGNTGTELSSSCSLEGCSTLLDKVAINRVPVISKSGKPLMPCKPAKARKLLQSGKAIKKWSKLGIFYIQLTFDPASEFNKNQKIILSADPGSNFDGCAVTTKIVNLTAMSELPSKIADKLESRREMRRARRFRNTRQRPKRFDNRNREGFIAPSQKAKVEFRLTIIKELYKLYPVTDFAVEDVRFNHYKKRWGRHFSTVEIGKSLLYSELRKMGELHIFEGHQTKEERERLGLKKVSKKNKRSPESHATDAIALASMVNPIDIVSLYPFYVWKRYQNSRRQLHRFEPDKKGIRRRYGGSDSIYPFKKNDVIIFDGELARTGGFMGKRMSLHNYNLDNNRFKQNASPSVCHRLFNQKIMFEVKHEGKNVNPAPITRSQIPLTAEAGEFLLAP